MFTLFKSDGNFELVMFTLFKSDGKFELNKELLIL